MSTDHTTAPEGVPMPEPAAYKSFPQSLTGDPPSRIPLFTEAQLRERDTAWQALYADRVAQAVADMEARKDGAYLERNQCVALIARMALAMGMRAGIARTAIEGWSDDWHGCVYIDLPTGQVSWHFHDSQAGLFDGLPPYSGAWDGHDTPEKYRRVGAALSAATAPAEPVAPKWRPCLNCGCDSTTGKVTHCFGCPNDIATFKPVAPSDEQREAARYRWLRDRAPGEIVFDHTRTPGDGSHFLLRVPFDGEPVHNDAHSGMKLDAAIDSEIERAATNATRGAQP